MFEFNKMIAVLQPYALFCFAMIRQGTLYICIYNIKKHMFSSIV